ncbi:hypothetical protein [Saccharopolyspora spinosa]|uniref:hypothetical protein n=1 Tax=Saccharopolyspora spinosa TaxID=60894 RepID=UPI003748AA79
MPQDEQLGILGRITTQEHGRDGQQLPGHLVQQRHDHSGMIPVNAELLFSPAAMTKPGSTELVLVWVVDQGWGC